MNVPAFTASGTGSAPLSIDNITVTQGTLSIGVTGGFSVKGNVTVSPGTTLNLNPATPATVTLNGASAQTITGGTINVTNNVTLAVDNPSGIVLGSNLTVGNASAGGGISFVNGRISTGANTLTLGAGADPERRERHELRERPAQEAGRNRRRRGQPDVGDRRFGPLRAGGAGHDHWCDELRRDVRRQERRPPERL